MKLFLLSLMVLLPVSFSAPHVHGAGNLSIAFDNTEGMIEFKVSSEALFGFEHAAKSDKEKKIVTDIISKFENEMAKWVGFEKSLNCLFTREKMEILTEGHHSDFFASFKVKCDKPLMNSKISLNFTDLKKIHQIDVTILIGDLQKSLKLRKKLEIVELK